MTIDKVVTNDSLEKRHCGWHVPDRLRRSARDEQHAAHLHQTELIPTASTERHRFHNVSSSAQRLQMSEDYAHYDSAPLDGMR
jgi:hypothetical protein